MMASKRCHEICSSGKKGSARGENHETLKRHMMKAVHDFFETRYLHNACHYKETTAHQTEELYIWHCGQQHQSTIGTVLSSVSFTIFEKRGWGGLALWWELSRTLADTRTLNRMLYIVDNTHHPLQHTFTRQRRVFSVRLLSQASSLDWLRNSFVLLAICLYNTSELWQGESTQWLHDLISHFPFYIIMHSCSESQLAGPVNVYLTVKPQL